MQGSDGVQVSGHHGIVAGIFYIIAQLSGACLGILLLVTSILLADCITACAAQSPDACSQYQLLHAACNSGLHRSMLALLLFL